MDKKKLASLCVAVILPNISSGFCLFNCNDAGSSSSNTTAPHKQGTAIEDKRLRLKFVSAIIKEPKELTVDDFKSLDGWKSVISRRYEAPDPYVVVFLNGKLVFVTPQDAILQDTYTPQWNVIMPEIVYSARDKDEITILVKDSDTNVAKGIADALSAFRVIEEGKESGFSIQLTEDSFNDDETLGRWSGKLPVDKLNQNVDIVWDVPSFGNVTALKILIEQLPIRSQYRP